MGSIHFNANTCIKIIKADINRSIISAAVFWLHQSISTLQNSQTLLLIETASVKNPIAVWQAESSKPNRNRLSKFYYEHVPIETAKTFCCIFCCSFHDIVLATTLTTTLSKQTQSSIHFNHPSISTIHHNLKQCCYEFHPFQPSIVIWSSFRELSQTLLLIETAKHFC